MMGFEREVILAWTTKFEEVSRVMKNDEMPLWDYVLMHPTAKLTLAETQQLLDGIQGTFQQDPPIPRPRRTASR